MNPVAHDLLENLQDQVRIYSHLLNLSRAQLAATQAKDVHSVHAILQELEMAMMERARHEQNRSRLISRAAVELGCTPEEVTATKLQATTDAAISGEIARCSDELKAIVQELDTVVARNRALLEHELAVMDHLVKGMTVDRTATPTYMRSGAQREAGRLRLLDAQV